MEIIPAYRQLLKVVKTHGMTEYSVPAHGDPNSLSVDEFLFCADTAWTDPRGLSGNLRLTASPSMTSLGLVELTMTISRIPNTPDTRAYFQISPHGIAVTRQQYNHRLQDWRDVPPPETGANYTRQLIQTADILNERWRDGK